MTKQNKGKPKKSNKKRGRKPILLMCPEVKDKLFKSIRLGSNYVTACGFAGIDYRNHFRNWVEKAEHEINRPDGIRKDYQLYVDFWMELQEAKAEGELECLYIMKKASYEDWHAAAWKLTRLYGHTKKTVIEGGENPIKFEDKTELIKGLLDKFPDKDKDNE